MVVFGNNLRLVGYVNRWVKVSWRVFQPDIIIAMGTFNLPGAVDLRDGAAPPDVYPHRFFPVGIDPVHAVKYIFQIVLAINFQRPIYNMQGCNFAVLHEIVTGANQTIRLTAVHHPVNVAQKVAHERLAVHPKQVLPVDANVTKQVHP
ncbi:hypothetical protein [Fodinibius sp. SL11]|uniref:hypothetical protein n=1 Tax=Fodinibius sp. SL11 TaxID=3425690 RepID=UPI003F883517